MGFIKRLLGKQRPTISKKDIPDMIKVAKFVKWFIENDPLVKVIRNRSSNIIFNEGYRPKAGNLNNPEKYNPNIKELWEWFFTKIYVDLNLLKDANKEEFRDFIDLLDEAGKKTLTNAFKISSKYGLSFENVSYEKEIEKIPEGKEREHFKMNFFEDNVLGAEIRILAWLYHEYFGEWYRLKENKNGKIGN